MRLFIALAACVLGQASDVLSTMAFRKLGIKEGNLLFQKMVARKQWGKFIAIKAIVITGVLVYTAYKAPAEKRLREVERAAWIAAWVDALAGAWNTVGTLRYSWKSRKHLTKT